MTQGPMKYCSKCGEEKLLSEFGKNTHAEDGLRCECRECTNACESAHLSYVLSDDRKKKKYYKGVKSRTKRYRKRIALLNKDREYDINGTNVCSCCGAEKPTTEFHKDRSRPDGLRKYCKMCIIERRTKGTQNPTCTLEEK